MDGSFDRLNMLVKHDATPRECCLLKTRRRTYTASRTCQHRPKYSFPKRYLFPSRSYRWKYDLPKQSEPALGCSNTPLCITLQMEQTRGETRYGSWESTFDGELKSWDVRVGDVVSRQWSRDRPALHVVEPCKHGIQVNGLCALCGMDMEK